jgi:hypothetical protein
MYLSLSMAVVGNSCFLLVDSIGASHQISVQFGRAVSEIDQSKTRIACGSHVCYGSNEMSKPVTIRHVQLQVEFFQAVLRRREYNSPKPLLHILKVDE